MRERERERRGDEAIELDVSVDTLCTRVSRDTPVYPSDTYTSSLRVHTLDQY
jgi:hypothetical protein